MAADEFAAFYGREYPGAKRLTHLVLDGSPAADDVVWAAFTRVASTYDVLSDPEASLRAAVIDGCRGRAGSPPTPVGEARSTGPVEIPDPLLEAVNVLPVRERAALVLRYWASLSDEEVGAAVGVEPALVGALILRALTGLATAGGAGHASAQRECQRLERDLVDAFAIAARSVAMPDPDWQGARPLRPTRRRHPLLPVAVAATIVVGLAVTWPRPALDGVVASRVVTLAAPLRPIAASDLVWAPSPFVVGPIHPGSFRAWQGLDEQVVTYQTIETRSAARVVEVWCFEWEHGRTTCFAEPVVDVPSYDSLDDRSNWAVDTAATARALECLGTAGVDSDPRRRPPPGVDAEKVWRQCVAAARVATRSMFEQLGGRVVDDRAEDPSIVTVDEFPTSSARPQTERLSGTHWCRAGRRADQQRVPKRHPAAPRTAPAPERSARDDAGRRGPRRGAELGDPNRIEVAVDATRDRGGGDDCRAVPVDGKHGEQTHPVDLGLGVQLHPAEAAARSSTRRNADPGGGSRRSYWASSVSGISPRPARRWPAGAMRSSSSANSGSIVSSGSSTGRCTTAALKRPPSRAGRRTDVLPSETIARMWGCVRERVGSRAGSNHRAVVPSIPRRTSPVTSPVDGSHVGRDVVELTKDAAGPLDHPGPVVGQLALGPVDEHRPELLLEAGDVARDVGLHRVQRPRRGRERAVVRDRDEGGELTHVHLSER